MRKIIMSARRQIVVLAMFALAWLAPNASAQVNEEAVSSLAELQDGYGKEIALRKKVDNAGVKKEIFVQTGKLASDLSYVLLNKDISDKDKRLLETIANYYVFRVTWSEYANDPDEMEYAINEFKLFYSSRIALSKNTEMVNYLNKKLIESFRKVLERDFMKNRLTSVNAAQMLPGLGKSKSDEISDFLIKLIKDANTHQAIKLYAIKALREYFPLVAETRDPFADLKRVQALTDYIEQKWEIKETNKERLEEQLAAVSFLRREAIQVLALAQAPIVPKLPPRKGVKNEGQVAITLLKVLAKNELSPPPPARGKINTIAVMGLAERVYASFGLCDFKSDPASGYQADLAVYAVGYCLSEFIEAYRADEDNLVKWDAKEFNPKNGERKVPQLPWKTMAEHWQSSLKNLVDTTDKSNNLTANSQAKLLQGKSGKLLDLMVAYKPIQLQDSDAFRRSVEGAVLKLKNVFKSNNVPEVNLGY
jgi:hypothetical protein